MISLVLKGNGRPQIPDLIHQKEKGDYQCISQHMNLCVDSVHFYFAECNVCVSAFSPYLFSSLIQSSLDFVVYVCWYDGGIVFCLITKCVQYSACLCSLLCIAARPFPMKFQETNRSSTVNIPEGASKVINSFIATLNVKTDSKQHLPLSETHPVQSHCCKSPEEGASGSAVIVAFVTKAMVIALKRWDRLRTSLWNPSTEGVLSVFLSW